MTGATVKLKRVSPASIVLRDVGERDSCPERPRSRMGFGWDLFPLLMQAVYLAAALPAMARLVRLKRSDQRAIADHWIALGARAGMLAWALAYARQPGMALGTLVAVATTLASAALILRYRRHPGGKPSSSGAAARPAIRAAPMRALPL